MKTATERRCYNAGSLVFVVAAPLCRGDGVILRNALARPIETANLFNQ